jgi:prephenate dehydratase
LLDYQRVAIVGETKHEIVQCLIGAPGAEIASIVEVRSHPVALDQCRAFLRTHAFAHVAAVHDTAGAVRAVVEAGDRSVAAIGPESAARRYGGVVLDRAIADEERNVTRFFVIARDGRPREKPTRLCLAFALPHEPGSLHRALGILAERGLNLRSLVARPRPKHPFEYVFYAELDAPESLDAPALAAQVSPQTRVLGRY